MDFKFNINSYVKVKLNENGISILKEKHDRLNDAIKKQGCEGFGAFKLKLDKDGYYETQMWCFIEDFSEHMHNGSKVPFDCNIICCKGEEI